MKTKKILAIAAIAGLLVVTLVGTQVLASTNVPSWPRSNNAETAPVSQNSQGYGRGHGPGNGTGPIVTLPTGDLSDDETAGLLYMREEEKLARDVYTTLGEQWDVQVFQNIARSEQRHMDAVATLLDRYGLEDPAANKAIGEFTNPDLQALYDELVAQGSTSLADALKVGAAIEEIDILDLKDYIAKTDNEDIQQVYERLMAGSENHLRAFTSTLETMTGESYGPQYLDLDTYNAIINSPHGNPAGAGEGHGPGHGHGRGGHGYGENVGSGAEHSGEMQGHGHGPHGAGNGECLEEGQ